MTRSEVGKDRIWAVPPERYKTKRWKFVPLSKAALDLIEDQPKLDNCDFVFLSRARTPFSAFGKSKSALDAAVLDAMRKQATDAGAVPEKIKPLPNWTLHDLRRTAKTLMASAGVRPDISERVLGHVIAGVEGVYDRHSYEAEKRDALEQLASLVERILTPLAPSVAALDEHRVRA